MKNESGAGFSLWNFKPANSKIHRLKPAPQVRGFIRDGQSENFAERSLANHDSQVTKHACYPAVAPISRNLAAERLASSVPGYRRITLRSSRIAAAFWPSSGQAITLPHSCGSRLETLRIVFDYFVVRVQRRLKLVLHERDFAKIKLRVRSQIGLAVKPQVVLKFLCREIIVLAVDVPQPVRIQEHRRMRADRRQPKVRAPGPGALPLGGIMGRPFGEFMVEGGATPAPPPPPPANFESTFCNVFWMSVSF